MREFSNKGSRLTAMPFEVRLLYTIYLLFTMAGYIVIGFMVWQRTGISPADYADYYQGNEARDMWGVTVPQLLETTHFHLFSYPLFLLVQGHIFLMCGWAPKLKLGIVLAACLGAAIYLASPWLVLWLGNGAAFAQVLGRALLVPPLLLFLFVPLWEMWKPRRTEREG